MYPSVDQLTPAISRRNFFRFAAGASALASMPILTEAHFAMAQLPKFADPNKGIHIDANQNPMGPSDAARKAIIDIIPRGGRYLFSSEEELAEIFAKQEGLNPDNVVPFAGSSAPTYSSGPQCCQFAPRGNSFVLYRIATPSASFGFTNPQLSHAA